jgi:CheY-like chemotaxis protein
LLVEDNPGDVILTRIAFEKCRVSGRLHVVDDGEKALQFLRGEGEYAGRLLPDLVLLDINLPRVNGLEVLRVVKSDENLRHVPVVVLTSSVRKQDIADAYGHHANGYITKPEGLPQLIEALQLVGDYWFVAVQHPLRDV